MCDFLMKRKDKAHLLRKKGQEVRRKGNAVRFYNNGSFQKKRTAAQVLTIVAAQGGVPFLFLAAGQGLYLFFTHGRVGAHTHLKVRLRCCLSMSHFKRWGWAPSVEKDKAHFFIQKEFSGIVILANQTRKSESRIN